VAQVAFHCARIAAMPLRFDGPEELHRAMMLVTPDEEMHRVQSEGDEDFPSPLPWRHAWRALALLAFMGTVGVVHSRWAGSSAAQEASTQNSLNMVELPALKNSKFVSNAKVMYVNWTQEEKSIPKALEETFPDGHGWIPTRFQEGGDTTKEWYWQDVAWWVKNQLLGNKSPFEDGVPIPDSGSNDTDQLNPGEYVAYTRRQVCYIAAKSLLGAGTSGYNNGLKRYLHERGPGGCIPQQQNFGKAMWGLLATCAADPTLEGGAQGPMILVAKNKELEINYDHLKSENIQLTQAGFRICRYDDGSIYKQGFLPGVPKSPEDLCSQPQWSGPGVDFLSSSRHMRQAVVDASGSHVGGKMFGGSCGSGGPEDQHLLMFMPEVAVLSFFLSQSEEQPQLAAPTWILGARMVNQGLDGTGRWAGNMRPEPGLRMASDLVQVELDGVSMMMSQAKPFVAVPPGISEAVFESSGADLKKARQNRLARQRIFGNSTDGFDEKVAVWYQAISLAAIPNELHGAFHTVVRSVGTGPWTSGLRFGDSQVDVLAIWLGQALASKSWGDGALLLDYYLYSSFVENPGNQCFLHSSQRCGDCLWTCNQRKIPKGSFYLPERAFMTNDDSKPCVGQSEFACSFNGIENVMWNFGLKSTAQLWRTVDLALKSHEGDVSRSVFDRVADERAHEAFQKMDPYST